VEEYGRKDNWVAGPNMIFNPGRKVVVGLGSRTWRYMMFNRRSQVGSGTG
jgi:hypothetical protein